MFKCFNIILEEKDNNLPKWLINKPRKNLFLMRLLMRWWIVNFKGSKISRETRRNKITLNSVRDQQKTKSSQTCESFRTNYIWKEPSLIKRQYQLSIDMISALFFCNRVTRVILSPGILRKRLLILCRWCFRWSRI